MLEKITKKNSIGQTCSEFTTHKVISLSLPAFLCWIYRTAQATRSHQKEKNKLLRTRSECQMRWKSLSRTHYTSSQTLNYSTQNHHQEQKWAAGQVSQTRRQDNVESNLWWNFAKKDQEINIVLFWHWRRCLAVIYLFFNEISRGKRNPRSHSPGCCL